MIFSDMEDTTTTELHVDSQVNEPNTEDDLPFIDSKIDFLVDTWNLLIHWIMENRLVL